MFSALTQRVVRVKRHVVVIPKSTSTLINDCNFKMTRGLVEVIECTAEVVDDEVTSSADSEFKVKCNRG